jgi:putative transcriptional regulator
MKNSHPPLTVADQIRLGLEQALAYAQGAPETLGPDSPWRAHIPAEIDVRGIRTRLGMTQHQFSLRFGFSLNTLRHWEQGRRVPEGPTRAYLLVIDRAPEAVQNALKMEMAS